MMLVPLFDPTFARLPQFQFTFEAKKRAMKTAELPSLRGKKLLVVFNFGIPNYSLTRIFAYYCGKLR